MSNISRQMDFEILSNTRDLGGIKTMDGAEIKEGRLIRSGHLFKANDADRQRLNTLGIKKIYDFRSLEGYIEKALKVDASMKEKIRNNYLR